MKRLSGEQFAGFLLSESMLSLAAIPVGLPHHQAKFMTYTVWSVRRKLCAVDRKVSWDARGTKAEKLKTVIWLLREKRLKRIKRR